MSILVPGSAALVNFMCFSNISTPINGTNVSVSIYRNTTLTAIDPTITNPAVGFYQVQFTIPTNWEQNDVVTALFSSTINGLTTQAHKIVGVVNTQVLDIFQRTGLDADNPVTLSRVGNTTTEVFSGKTLTHVVDEENDSVVVTRT